MRTIIGLIGITMIGIGTATLLVNWKVGLCAGIILLGMGLIFDAVRK